MGTEAASGLGVLAIVAALGMRHGVDPDHLSAIDGLSRFHPSRWNGGRLRQGDLGDRRTMAGLDLDRGRPGQCIPVVSARAGPSPPCSGGIAGESRHARCDLRHGVRDRQPDFGVVDCRTHESVDSWRGVFTGNGARRRRGWLDGGTDPAACPGQYTAGAQGQSSVARIERAGDSVFVRVGSCGLCQDRHRPDCPAARIDDVHGAVWPSLVGLVERTNGSGASLNLASLNPPGRADVLQPT